MAEKYMVSCGLMISLVSFLFFFPTDSSEFATHHIIYDFVANLVLEDTYERIYHNNQFAEAPLGVFVVRGENVVLLGEIVRCLSSDL